MAVRRSMSVAMGATLVRRMAVVAALSSPAAQIIRPFFASSTDHTRLLHDAEVHRLPVAKDGVRQYVMASAGMDAAMVHKVPQLHLARLFVEDNGTLYGAKVINRTLGSLDAVCGKLVDAALADVRGAARARSTLHGLSEFVLLGIETLDGSNAAAAAAHPASSCREILQGLSIADLSAVKAIASSKSNEEEEEEECASAKRTWELLAWEFVGQKQSSETLLYLSKGATLASIAHRSDTSDFSNTCGGAMVLLRF